MITFLPLEETANRFGAVIVLDSLLIAAGLAFAVPACKSGRAEESGKEDGRKFKLHFEVGDRTLERN